MLSGESILVIIIIGLVAGWLAGKIVRGTGYGFVADIFGKRTTIRAVGKIFRRSTITDSVVDILLKARYLRFIPR